MLIVASNFRLLEGLERVLSVEREIPTLFIGLNARFRGLTYLIMVKLSNSIYQFYASAQQDKDIFIF